MPWKTWGLVKNLSLDVWTRTTINYNCVFALHKWNMLMSHESLKELSGGLQSRIVGLLIAEKV